MNYAEQIYKERGLEGLKEAYDKWIEIVHYMLKNEIGNIQVINTKDWGIDTNKLHIVDLKCPKDKEAELLDGSWLGEEGWDIIKTNNRHNSVYYERDIWRIFMDEVEMQIEDVNYEGYIYSGKIPTIEQWETLKELLNIKY